MVAKRGGTSERQSTKPRIFIWTELFESNLSAAEWAWRIFAVILVTAGGTTAGLAARANAAVHALGGIVWIAIGIIAAASLAGILLLVKTASLRDAEAAYTRKMATLEGHSLNPLLDSYTDVVIPVEALRLPGQLLHERKQFKRCKFVGPGALVLLGGSFVRCSFHDAGDIIPLPNQTQITGIVILKDCTVEDCEFFRTTVLAPSGAFGGLRAMGARIAGE